jgi:predicted transcriptional regulator
VTRLLETAVEKVRALPDAEQDALARLLLDLVGVEQSLVALTPEEEADLAEALAEADRGEFASEDEMRALWAKYA